MCEGPGCKAEALVRGCPVTFNTILTYYQTFSCIGDSSWTALPLEVKEIKSIIIFSLPFKVFFLYKIQTCYIFLELKVTKLLFSVEQQVFLDCSTLKMKGAR